MGITFYADHHWESPYVFSVFVALREKGIDATTVELVLDRGDQRAASYAGALTARVPAIEHDGFWLSESLAIAEYLEEQFPSPPLFPTGVRERARARQILGWLRSDLLPLREERPTTTIFFAPATAPLGPRAQAAADKLIRVASELVRPGAATIFDRFTLVDADLAIMLHRLICSGDPLPDGLSAYAKGIWSRPSCRAFVDLKRPPLAG